MNELTMNECSKRKLDDTYLVVYAIKNDINIKKGDYIGILITPEHMEYWCITNDGKNNYDNAHTLFGVRPLFRTCTAYPVDTSEFNA